MTSTKPRIIKRNGIWTVRKPLGPWLGIEAYKTIGYGATITEAWWNAFPSGW